jgi:hypothetical protein
MLTQIDAFVIDSVHGTPFEYWLLEREGQATAAFLTVMLCSLFWLIVLEYSSRRSKRMAPEPSSAADVELHDPPADEMSIMKRLAPAGHRPTNAQLNTSPFHLARGFAKRKSIATSSLFASPVRDNNNPSGVAAAELTDRELKPDHDKLSLTSTPQGRNFSGLAKYAPVSYETLRERGSLDKDGSPTRKYVTRKRRDELMGRVRNKQIKYAFSKDPLAFLGRS